MIITQPYRHHRLRYAERFILGTLKIEPVIVGNSYFSVILSILSFSSPLHVVKQKDLRAKTKQQGSKLRALFMGVGPLFDLLSGLTLSRPQCPEQSSDYIQTQAPLLVAVKTQHLALEALLIDVAWVMVGI